MDKKKWFLNGGRGSGRSFRLLCETYENKIAALEKENAEFKQAKEGKVVEHFEAYGQCRDSRRIAELEAQIEKMKCCGNCENGELSAHEEPCLHCQRCFASKDITDQENVKDSWKAIKEIKEND